MKKVDAKYVLKNPIGKDWEIQGGPEKGPVVLGKLLSDTLATTRCTNPSLAWVLSKKFATQDEVELKAEEIVFIKEIISKSDLFPQAGGQIVDVIES